MAKQLNVNMSVRADTSQAKKQLKELHNELSKIQATPAQLFDDQNLKRASQAAQELQKHLRECTDVNTGKLDLSKFATQLKQSGKSLTKYKEDLTSLGPAGNQAFLMLSRSIASADAPLLKMNAKMQEFLTTLKNTARWQLSSSIVHGLMGSVQAAYGYAKDLDRSLNNIRIVSGQNTQQMADFAEQANKSAQALSTTTTAYTDAALIFYQQGLSGDEVTERTDAVIKMANVTGESAEEVSSYMTAIWNNFNSKSDQSAKHFEDILAALGASTASSTAEIAQGLEKFASIAEVTGLSYEYATSALATLVANTRQSADTVGTSLKTIFSRLQGLKLGETLEDGVDLNKYSEALSKVGVSVLDTSGELRKMDDILDELGQRWGTLTNAQQMALAQTVAGVRQYNNLISLMDNWGDMQKNVETALSADGTIDEQASIYAESWEAARDRVKAASEEIYSALIDEDFFISIDNALVGILHTVKGLIDGMGGLPGLLGTIGGFITQRLAKEAPQAIQNIGAGLAVITGHANKLAKNMQQENLTLLNSLDTTGDDSAFNAQVEGLRKVQEMKRNLIAVQGTLSTAEKEAAEAQITDLESVIGLIAEQGRKLDENREKTQQSKDSFIDNISQKANTKAGNESGSDAYDKTNKKVELLTNLLQKASIAQAKYNLTVSQAKKQAEIWSKQAKDIKSASAEAEVFKKKIKEYTASLDLNDADDSVIQLKADLEDPLISVEQLAEDFEKVSQSGTAIQATNPFTGMKDGAQGFEDSINKIDAKLRAMGANQNELDALKEKFAQGAISAETYEKELENIAKKTAEIPQHTASVAEAITSVSGAAMSLSGLLSTATNSFQTLFSDDNATAVQKITAVIGLLTTAVMTFNSVSKAVATIQAAVKGAKLASAAASGALMLVVAAIAAVTAGLEAQTKKHKEAAEETQKNSDATKELTDSHEDLLRSYREGLTVLNETGEVTDNLRETALKLAEAYGVEGAALAALTGDYSKLNEEIAKKRSEELADAIDTEESNVSAQGQVFIDQMRDDVGNFSDGMYNAKIGGGASDKDEAKVKAIVDAGITSGKYTHLAHDGNDINIKAQQNAADMTAAYEEIEAIYKEASKNMTDAEIQASENMQHMKEWLAKSQEGYEAYKAAIKQLEEYGVEKATIDNIGVMANEVQTLTEYQQRRTDVINQSVKETAQAEGLLDASGNVLEGCEERYKRIQEDTEKAVDGYLSTYDNINQLQQLDRGLSDLETKGISKETAESFYNSLSDEDKTFFWSIDFDTAKTKAAWDREIDFLKNQAKEASIEASLDLTTKTSSNLSSGKTMTEEERAALEQSYTDAKIDFDWEKFDVSSQIEQIEMLAQATGELNKQKLETYETNKRELEINTQLEAERQEALEETQRQYEALLKKQEDMLKRSDIGSTPWSEEWKAVQSQIASVESEIDDLTNTKYNLEIEVDIEDTMLDIFTNSVDILVSKADQLQRAAEAIGESWKVAADDVSILSDVFPEILENAQVLADGTVQLDEEVCKRVMENNGLIVSSDTEATGTQLENKLALLDAEISYEKHKAQLLQDYLNGVIDESQLEDGIKKAGAEFEQDLREAGLNDQANALSEMFANQSASTKSALDLLNQIDAKIQQVSENYSKMLSGEVVKAVETQMTGSGPALSSKYTQTNVGELDNTKNKNYEEYKAQYEATLARIAELENARGDYTELLAKLRKEAEETKKAIDGAASGKGGLQKKDSGKTEKPKDPEFVNYKKLSDVVERYHEIEEALEDINHELERIDKTESRTYGKSRMSVLKSKIDGYKNEAAALERYAAEAEKYLKEDSTKASQAGWKFDSNGNVSNYEENLRSITEKYNQIIAAYNTMTAEQQEEYKKQLNGEGKNPLQQAEEEYKNALDALKQYEETADKYQDIQDKILENRRNIADAQLEVIELTIELNLEVDERNIALLEELFENMGDSADYVVDKIENIEKRIDAVIGKVETTRQAMKDTFDLLGEYNDNIDGGMLERMLTGNMTPEDLQNIADAVSNSDGVLNYDEIMANIKEYADSLLQYNQELRDLRESVYNELENAMDKYSEEFDKVDDKIAHSKKMLSGYKDIVSALGKANVDPTGALTRRLNENTIKTNESDWRAANARQEAMKKAKADAEEGLRKAKESGSEYDIARWTAILEKAQNDLTDAEENAQDKLVEWIESIGEAFKAEIEQVIEDLDKELGSLTNLRENFDRQQTLNEQYVDDYEKIYQLSKMTRDINKTIDETDSVNAKKSLMEFQQKINKYQEDGVQMSQYEVENLQRQLELEKAKIQLDEAKDEKSQVRMQRDAEGNYGYVYTANETDVAAAEQNYEDKLHEIQVANGNYINELQDSIITMQEECSAKIKEIMLDESLSMEERMAKVEETRDYYQKRLEYYSGQLGIVLDNNKELYENEWLEYNERTGYKISRNEDYVDSWQETSLGILTETENQAAYMERVEEAIDAATDRMAEAMENYQDRTSEAMDQAGYDIDNLAEDIGDRSDEVTEDAQNAADEAERLEDEYEQHLGDAMDATIDFTENYGQAIQDCIDENNRIIDSINDVIAALAEMASTAESSYNNINIPNVPSGGGSDTPGAGGGPGSGGSGGSGSGSGDGGGNPGTKDYYVVIADTAGGKGNGHIYGFSGNHDKSDCESYLSQHKEDIIRTGNYNPRIVTRKSILGYDTGGYTGSWGSSEGKLAFLHQKELVLNAADTQNMLDIVDMVRDISRMIDINALSSMITSGLTTASVNTNNHDVIEQHVEITAEFHDATTATEITDAFENLINRATQYANRK